MILFDPDLKQEVLPSSSRKRTSRTPSGAARAAGALPSGLALSRFLGRAQRAIRLEGEVNILLTTDTSIRRLNRQFRGKNKPTDVLSFPADGPAAQRIAGDLAISIPTARRQAAAEQHTLTIEIKVLLLHGLLHLAGFDHETDTGQMARRERVLRRQLGLPLGLIERAGAAAPRKRAVKRPR